MADEGNENNSDDIYDYPSRLAYVFSLKQIHWLLVKWQILDENQGGIFQEII